LATQIDRYTFKVVTLQETWQQWGIKKKYGGSLAIGTVGDEKKEREAFGTTIDHFGWWKGKVFLTGQTLRTSNQGTNCRFENTRDWRKIQMIVWKKTPPFFLTKTMSQLITLAFKFTIPYQKIVWLKGMDGVMKNSRTLLTAFPAGNYLVKKIALANKQSQ